MDLEAADLCTFSRMVLGENVIRLNYITNVLLTIKVATYDLSVADKPESETIVAQLVTSLLQA